LQQFVEIYQKITENQSALESYIYELYGSQSSRITETACDITYRHSVNPNESTIMVSYRAEHLIGALLREEIAFNNSTFPSIRDFGDVIVESASVLSIVEENVMKLKGLLAKELTMDVKREAQHEINCIIMAIEKKKKKFLALFCPAFPGSKSSDVVKSLINQSTILGQNINLTAAINLPEDNAINTFAAISGFFCLAYSLLGEKATSFLSAIQNEPISIMKGKITTLRDSLQQLTSLRHYATSIMSARVRMMQWIIGDPAAISNMKTWVQSHQTTVNKEVAGSMIVYTLRSQVATFKVITGNEGTSYYSSTKKEQKTQMR
jgi:hypothetical protein